jgi:hypothetical protein
MRKLVAIVALGITLAAPLTAMADVRVSGYTKSNGTYVDSYVRSSPDSSTTNNYGSR